ncbi:hypothetical protein AWV80_10730 [Cupriavidus sp. UYMU48A]|nr:hypothetical protein AWV80_10730 [Cupriavidus sp. UYMU48A]
MGPFFHCLKTRHRNHDLFRIRPGPLGRARFRQALAEEHPLQVVGTINANHALLAKRAGYRAIYLSGGGVAAGSLGLPDLGISGLEDVLIDVRRISDEGAQGRRPGERGRESSCRLRYSVFGLKRTAPHTRL